MKKPEQIETIFFIIHILHMSMRDYDVMEGIVGFALFIQALRCNICYDL